MRILLIEPAKSPVSMAGEDVFLFEPLALEYLAAGVNDDHEVRILDQRIDDTVLAKFRRWSKRLRTLYLDYGRAHRVS